MVIVRLLGGWFLIGSVIVLIGDLTLRTTQKGGFVFNSLLSAWATIQPVSLALAKQTIESQVHRLAWDPVLLTFLKLPGFVVLAAVGVLLLYIGRKRRRVAVFAN